MPTYKILGADRQEYGPVTAEVLRQWITQRRASANTPIQIEGASDWKPLSSLPEFTDALVQGPTVSPTPPPMEPVNTSRLAIASLVCGILGFLCLPAVAGVVLGIMALMKINKSQGRLRGQGLAVAGLCISGMMMIAVVPAGMLLPALSKAKAKAMRIHCVSNLKQIGLGARMYSGDNKEVFPPDFLSMSNELNSPKILVCPADTKHIAVGTWAEFNPNQNLTYEYLKPGISGTIALTEVIFRCPIHNNVGLGDGSVQMTADRTSPRPPR